MFPELFYYVISTIIFELSSSRNAMTAPRIRYAVGSPDGLRCRHFTLVPSISPKSWSRLRILPSFFSFVTLAHIPSVRENRLVSMFIGVLP